MISSCKLLPGATQAQALPVVMSGRDCIGVAKTGSGKTLAFVLPMLRHIKVSPIAGDLGSKFHAMHSILQSLSTAWFSRNPRAPHSCRHAPSAS